MTLNIIILAAGRGKRMSSALPKVLHTLAGNPLLERVVNTANHLNPAAIYVVYGHEGELVKNRLEHLNVNWIEQVEQLGTGHAVAQAIAHVEDQSRVLVLVGDIPLITAATLQKLIAQTPAGGLGIVTANLANPTGLGRVLRDKDQKMVAIVEEKDASEQQKQIHEINSGILIAPALALKRWLPALQNNNAQGEYYLPDIVSMAVAENVTVSTVLVDSAEEVQGVNDRSQLVMLERYYQRQQAEKLMLSGVTILDPNRFDLRGEAKIAADVTIDINVVMEGRISIGKGSYIGPHVILKNVDIGENVEIKAHSVIEGASVENDCTIGPFARIRPGTKLSVGVHVGNFVEIKKSTVGAKSKINHLSYVGDATIGQAVNIGAGTITCNYDGVNKHPTVIGDGAFIGSNTSLVAPIEVGRGATVGAGSTLSRNVPADQLTLTRSEQKTIQGWKRPIKK